MSEAQAQQTKPRRTVQSGPVRVIAVTSGKGGVGKTNVSVNLGVSLANAGKQVMLMDADLGLANVDIMLGLQTKYNLSHVINGERSLEEIIVEGPAGLSIVPASSGILAMADLEPAQHAGVIRAFSELDRPLDVLLIDTAAGISDSVISFSKAAQEVIVVICDEPASITDAYAMIKIFHREYGMYRFRIVTNMVTSAQAGIDLYRKIVRVTDRYLDVALDYMGSVPSDDFLRKAIQRQSAVCEAYPRSKSAIAFKKLASKAANWPMPATAGGRLEFFIERLILSSARS